MIRATEVTRYIPTVLKAPVGEAAQEVVELHHDQIITKFSEMLAVAGLVTWHKTDKDPLPGTIEASSLDIRCFSSVVLRIDDQESKIIFEAVASYQATHPNTKAADIFTEDVHPIVTVYVTDPTLQREYPIAITLENPVIATYRQLSAPEDRDKLPGEDSAYAYMEAFLKSTPRPDLAQQEYDKLHNHGRGPARLPKFMFDVQLWKDLQT